MLQEYYEDLVKKFLEEERQWLETIETLDKTITEKDL